MRTAISFATKLSGIETATQPARMMAKYAVTACTFMGMSIAMASPVLNPSASRAFATRLHVQRETSHEAQKQKQGEEEAKGDEGEKEQT